jgi:two-component system LytT family sensor kinase
MKFNTLSRKETIRHLLCWLAIGVFFEIYTPTPGGIWEIISEEAAFLVPCMLVYYPFLLVIFPSYWEKRSWLLLPTTGGVLLPYTFFVYLGTADMVQSGQVSIPFFLFDTFLYFGLTAAAAFATYINRRALEKIREQDQKEKTLLLKELGSLKDQFASGFIDRFLNFIREEIKTSSEEAARAITLFSNIIRYSFQTHPNEMVELNKEMEYISNYVALHQCLHSDSQIRWECEGNLHENRILPRLLITLVENAFKHGIVNDMESPVQIKLRALPESILFEVINRKDLDKKNEVSGLGQVNFRQLLSLYYPDKHEVTITNQADTYSCKLKLLL